MGSLGSHLSNFHRPISCVALPDSHLLVVLDQGNSRLIVTNLEGKRLSFTPFHHTREGTEATGCAAIDPFVFLLWPENKLVHIFMMNKTSSSSSSNTLVYVQSFSVSPKYGSVAHIAADPSTPCLFLSCPEDLSVLVTTPDGTLLRIIKSNDTFDTMTSLSVSDSLLWVSDILYNVHVFTPTGTHVGQFSCKSSSGKMGVVTSVMMVSDGKQLLLADSAFCSLRLYDFC
jgi:hypothetical protein